jgi:hypothetical protein
VILDEFLFGLANYLGFVCLINDVVSFKQPLKHHSAATTQVGDSLPFSAFRRQIVLEEMKNDSMPRRKLPVFLLH